MPFDWLNITRDALVDLYGGIVNFAPLLIGALIVFIIGWFISIGVGKLVADVLKKIRFNQIFERGNWKEALAKADIKVDPSGFVGAIFKWILVIVFLLAAVDILGLSEFANFLQGILDYLPNVMVAALIFVVAVVIADISEKILRTAVESTQIGYGHFVSIIVKWSIWVFAVVAILVQLQVAVLLLQTLFTGLVAMVAIAGGLAFGFGGRDIAAEVLEALKGKLKG